MRLDSRLARAKLVLRRVNTCGAERELLVGWGVEYLRVGAFDFGWAHGAKMIKFVDETTPYRVVIRTFFARSRRD
jgi:hypothetical protein